MTLSHACDIGSQACTTCSIPRQEARGCCNQWRTLAREVDKSCNFVSNLRKMKYCANMLRNAKYSQFNI